MYMPVLIKEYFFQHIDYLLNQNGSMLLQHQLETENTMHIEVKRNIRGLVNILDPRKEELKVINQQTLNLEKETMGVLLDGQMMEPILQFKLNHILQMILVFMIWLEMFQNGLQMFTDLQQMTRQAILTCLLYTSPSPRDVEESRMPSSA